MTTLNPMKKKRRPLQAAPFRESLHESLTDQLRSMILKHELQPGEWIQEMQLCESLGVSRTPMREALKVLASERLVVLHPYRGASVAEIELGVVAELFEVQAILESQAGLLACERATDAEIQAFSAKHDEMAGHFSGGDRVSYFRLNQELHAAIVGMAANTRLQESHAAIMKQISHARYAALDEENRWKVSIEQHAAIRDALVQRDGSALASCIVEHVNDTKKAVLRSLEVEG
jgi:DNA-binding GntR family transcriptional regulator